MNRVFFIQGAVISSIDPTTAEALKKPAGMLVGIIGGPEAIAAELNAAISEDEKYENLTGSDAPDIPEAIADTGSPVPPEIEAGEAGLPEGKIPADNGDPDLTMEWLQEAISQEETVREQEAAPQIILPPAGEKKNLTSTEREKIQPAGQFLMDLTKAMLRSGYYSADHPGAKNAKRGLYDRFQKCLADSDEMMITNQETREKTDILITGILDEPVNVRQLVGAGQGELFVPKLREYFNRKGLVSFAMKKRITPEHFEGFVDIMSDPRADRGENARVGELLSSALVKNGITEISAVFIDDIIALELNLPWRVEMAIQRLAKDLKVLPMFARKSDDSIREMKLQIIQDIIRPLRHPEFLKDLIINCYIIAQYVKDVETEDIEKVIIDAFPLNTLLPTSQFIFDELNRLREMNSENPENPKLLRRVAGVKRILKWVVGRLLASDVRGAQHFLEKLYLNEVLTFEELPPDVQYLVNTMKMTQDVQDHTARYAYRITHAADTENAAILLKCFRRIMPVLIEQDDWQVILSLTRAVSEAGTSNGAFSGTIGLPPKPHTYIFRGLSDEIYEAYVRSDENQRPLVAKVVSRLGIQGIEILSKILSECDDRGARKEATDMLIKTGDRARSWVLKVLDDAKQPWYLQRNALMILRHVAKQEGDINRARRLVGHSHPRIRDEALNTLIALKATDAEQIVIAALNDPDDKVRWRATAALSELSPLSAPSIGKILALIKAESPEEKAEALKHARQVSQLIRSLGTLAGIQNLIQLEDSILDIGQNAAGQKKGLLQRFKKSNAADQSLILSAAIATLGKIGTPKSASFLDKMVASKTAQSEPARNALAEIRLRYAKQNAAAPADVRV